MGRSMPLDDVCMEMPMWAEAGDEKRRNAEVSTEN